MASKQADFAGNGTIKCDFCGHPVAEHEIRPCPEAGVDMLRVVRHTKKRRRKASR